MHPTASTPNAHTGVLRGLIGRLGLGGRVLRNSFYLFLANGVAKLLAFALNVLIIWTVSEESFGAYRWAVAYVGVFANLVELGLLRVGVRAIARSPGDAVAVFHGLNRAKAWLCLGTGMLIVGITEGGLRGIDDFPLLRLLSYLWFLVVIIHVLKKSHEAVFLGLERMGWTAVFLVGNRLLTLSAAAYFLYYSDSLIGLFAVFLAVDTIDLFMQGMAMRHTLRRDLPAIVEAHHRHDAETGVVSDVESGAFDTPRGPRAWIRESLPFGLQELTAEIYMRMDSVMLGLMLSQTAVSDYNKAYLILTAVLVLPNALSQAIFPQLSAMFRRHPLEMRRYFRQNYLMMIALGPTVMAALMVLAPVVLTAMKGNTPDVHHVYLVAMSTLPIYFLTMPLSYFLSAVYRQTFVTWVSVSMALFNIVANWFLIPHLGPLGAAMATFATECLALLCFATYLQNRFPGLFDRKGLLGLGLMHATALAIGFAIWPLGWLAQGAWLAIYGGVTAWLLAALRMAASQPSQQPAQ